MLRGLLKLTWLEFKIFLREPMGSVSTFILPVIVFVLIGNMLQRSSSPEFDAGGFLDGSLPVLVAMVILLNNVTSLATILSIYREGGILKRLKATPLTPLTILTAHVLVKLGITAINIGTLILVGKTFFDVGLAANPIGFACAAAISSASILSAGFIIASLVPTARFAQITATLILYPLLTISGLFGNVADFPPALRIASNASPLTHAVTVLRETWQGAPLHTLLPQLAFLALTFAACATLSSRIFRWE